MSREQFDAFHGYLRQAEQVLIDVTARDPGMLLAWHERLVTCRGLELGQAEARRRYDQLAKIDPHHYAAQSTYLQQLCPKWGGDWDAAHAFATQRAAAAPGGAMNGALVAEAHLEHLSDLKPDVHPEYLRNPDVRNDLRAAADRSVLSPLFMRSWKWADAANSFAMLFSLIADTDRAAACFRVIGDERTEYPWLGLGDPKAAFAKHRELNLGKATS